MERRKYTITLSDGNQFEIIAYGWRGALNKATIILDRDYAGCEILSVEYCLD